MMTRNFLAPLLFGSLLMSFGHTVAAQPSVPEVPPAMIEPAERDGMTHDIGTTTAIDGSLLLTDARANITLAWISGLEVYSARYDGQHDQWSAPALINTVPKPLKDRRTFGLSGVVDTEGNVVIAWAQDTGRGRSIFAARFDVATAHWLPSTRISGPDSSDIWEAPMANSPILTVDRANNITVVWNQELLPSSKGTVSRLFAAYGQGRQYATFATRYDSASRSWGAPQALGKHASFGFGASNHQVAIDPEGNVTVAWYQQNARPGMLTITPQEVIVAVRYNARSKRWSSQATLAKCSGSGDNADCNPALTVDPEGNILALWSDGDGWSAHYDARKNRWANMVSLPVTNRDLRASLIQPIAGMGFTLFWASNDEPRNMPSMEAWEKAEALPVSFGVSALNYLPKENRWVALDNLSNKTFAQVILRDLRKDVLREGPMVRPFLSGQGGADAFWVSKGKVETDRSLAPITIHSAHYEPGGAWRVGKSLELRPRDLYPFDSMWWDSSDPPTVLREASDTLLFAWAGEFTKALANNSEQDYRNQVRSSPRIIGSMVLTARYHPSTGAWSELHVLDGEDPTPAYKSAKPHVIGLVSLPTGETIAVWCMDSSQGWVLKSRLLSAEFQRETDTD